MSEQRYTDFLNVSSIGHAHLLSAAQKAFRRAETAGSRRAASVMVEEGAQLLCRSWCESLLNVPLAGEILRLSQSLPVFKNLLGPYGMRLAATVSSGGGGDDPELNDIFLGGRYDELDARLESAADGGAVFAAVRQAMLYQGALSRWDWLSDFLSRRLAGQDICDLLHADVLLADGQYERAVHLYEHIRERGDLPGLAYKHAVACDGMGDVQRALELLAGEVAAFPSHSSAILLMDRIAFPAARGSRLDGRCVVCIYSFNKETELARTLESVLASDLGPSVGEVSIKVLVNGSNDNSLAVAEAARDGFKGEMDVIHLPVNVGAPAARNWLLNGARKEGAEWIVYLDDDVLVESDWLAGLASGAAEYPDAGVWGCRVGDAGSHSLIQHGDGFLCDREDAARQERIVAVHGPSAECLVPRQLDYRRHCATVTGCCHLFRTETLSGSKGFDLKFSPSQYDDLDSDLRLLSAGKPAVYLGDVAIRHLRPSPRLTAQSEAGRTQSENHHALLEARHVDHLDSLLQVQSSFMKADLADKRTRLREAGYLEVSR